MKRAYVVITLAVAVMSTFGFVIKNQEPRDEKETNYVSVKHGAEKTGFTETISL